MLNGFKRSILFSIVSLLIISPSASFALRYDDGEGDGYWDYHGSGRDHPYSEYVGVYYNPGYTDYSKLQPEYIDEIVLTKPPSNIFTVNIPNRHGGYTAVIIKRSGNGYIGPQGEYYPEFPKIFQLEIMYGN